MPQLPSDLIGLPIYSEQGSFCDTEYGWRFFPGSVGLRKTLYRLRSLGFTAKRMACGTYRVTP